MKKIILSLCVLLFSVNLHADGKLLFDLTEQHFSNTILDKKNNFINGGNYDLANVRIKTDTYQKGSNYFSIEGNIATFTVTTKTNPKNWQVFVSLFKGSRTNPMIRIGSSSGDNHIISISSSRISIDDKVFEIDSLNEKKYNVIVKNKKNGIMIFKINGQQFYKTKSNNFGLRNIEVSLSNRRAYTADYLSHLEILSIE